MTQPSPAHCLVSLMTGDRRCAPICGAPDQDARACAAFDVDTITQTAVHMQRVMLTGTLASGFVHDINNLLTLVDAGAEAAVEALPVGHAARADLDLVLRSSAAIGAVARRLLAFVRRQPLEAGIVDLRDVLAHSLPLLERLLGSRFIVKTQVEPDTWSVWADPIAVEQILLNLLVNARGAMPDGGRVTIGAANVYGGEELGLAPGAYVCLSVADTGRGIRDELIGRVFEPFFSEGRDSTGVGVGLSTCRFLAQLLGGAITVISQPGVGATFYVYLPRAESVSPSRYSDGRNH